MSTSKHAGYTVVELLVTVAVVAILGLGVFKLLGFDGCSSCSGTVGTPLSIVDDGVLPGDVHEICLGGYMYYYAQSRWEGYARAVMAPKWDEEGKPARCILEKK